MKENKKTAAIVSLYGNSNFGNKLQNYAVQEILKKEGLNTVNIVNVPCLNNKKVNNIEVLKLYIKGWLRYILKGDKIKDCVDPKDPKERKKNFLEFNKKIANSKHFFSFSRLQEFDKYDYYFVGSDQIWNPIYGGLSDLDLLTFTQKKKIAISASFGIEEIPLDYKGRVKQYAVSQEERKEKIRARYKGVDRSELEFIPAKQKEKLFEDTGTKRVCAYCRVSTDDVNQTSSYELQKNHYEDMIKEHQGWELVGIYADEGISGTSLQHRDEFNQMIEDCKAGKIDLIVTKSVSRFARNIVDCIAKVRELANMRPQVGVFFETEHIYTLDNTSEMMLAVLSAAAQEESHTKSEIMNISIEQRFSRGIFLTPKLLGYDIGEDGNLVINEEEAETVRLCYYLFLNGFPTAEIADILTQLKRKTKPGNTKWSSSSIVSLLRNERYCGDVLSRKTFTPNYLDHKAKKNRHDRNQYRQSDHHEAIVDRDIYNAAQKMLTAARYAKKGFPFPNLKVVDEGALKGFVSVNRSWTGFTGEDYEKASQSAYYDQTDIDDTEKEERKDSGFDLSGYEIVRAQFFSTRLNPAMTISEEKVTFNTACLKKFENVEYVEILFNSVEKCIAVRPCDKDDINAVKWGTIRNGKWAVLPKSCKGFS